MRTLIMLSASAMAAVLALVVGCSDSASPGVEPEVTNVADSFQYQVTGVQNYTGQSDYMWPNSGVQANVNQSTTIVGGDIGLVILDAVGTQVYARSLGDNGTFVTAVGIPGSWTIRLDYSSASGTVNFRVQKRP
jgi:outer membrane protein assembly factor BamA